MAWCRGAKKPCTLFENPKPITNWLNRQLKKNTVSRQICLSEQLPKIFFFWSFLMSFSQPAENRSGKHSIWHANSWVCKKKKNFWGWSEAAGRRYIFIWCLSYSFMHLIKPGHSICVQKGSSRKSKWLLRATELLGHHDKRRRLPHSPNNRLQEDPV